jgi:predicted metalloprotease
MTRGTPGDAAKPSKREPAVTRDRERDGLPTTGDDALKKDRTLHRPGEVVDPGADTGHWSSMYEFQEYVLYDVDRFWTNMYAYWGVEAPYVNFAFMAPGEVLPTACTNPVTGQAANADDHAFFYCPADDTIYASQKMAQDLWNGTFTSPALGGAPLGATIGDFVVAYALAHEYAHNIQSEFGLNVPGAARELNADCMAGIWANAAYYEGILDANDINEGLTAAWLVGDDPINGSRDPHGTSDQRVQAFWDGYNSGDVGTCNGYLQ